jgi:hypothetical protein
MYEEDLKYGHDSSSESHSLRSREFIGGSVEYLRKSSIDSENDVGISATDH